MRRTTLCALALSIGLHALPLRAAPAPDGAPPPSEAIRGSWRGKSTCTDLKAAPSCKDEEVLYEFTPAGETKVHQKADKLVDGNWVTMGEMDFDYDASGHVWKSEFQSPRFHGLWSYSVSGDRLTGTLIDVPSRAILRKATCARP